MIYLTAEHQNPPRTITKGDVQYPVARYIEQGDTAALATLGVYPHEYYTGTDASLGVEWQYDDADVKWVQVPIGTEQERNLAVNRVKWKRQSEWRKRQAAQKIIDSPDSDPADRVRALQQLTGI